MKKLFLVWTDGLDVDLSPIVVSASHAGLAKRAAKKYYRQSEAELIVNCDEMVAQLVTPIEGK